MTIERFAATAALTQVEDETIAELESIVGRMRAAADVRNTDRLTESDLAFHRCLVEAGGHAHALQLWKSIHPRIQAQLHRIGRGRTSSFEQIPQEHQLLLDVLQAGDPEQLATALERHIMDDARRFMPRSQA